MRAAPSLTLVVELPAGRLEHPIAGDVCEIVRRLTKVVPANGTWSITTNTPNPSKVVGPDPAITQEAQPT